MSRKLSTAEVLLAGNPQTVDDLLRMMKRVGSRYFGYSLQNLFELENGRFQANVRHGQSCYEFGLGETPYAALIEAFRKALDGTPGVPLDQALAAARNEDEDLIG